MKKLFIIIFIFSLSHFNLASSNTNISFIDMNKVLSASKVGSSLLKQLRDLEEKNKQSFTKTESILKKKESEIISQKNILSVEEYKKKIIDLKLEVKKYNQNRKKTINNINQKKIENTNALIQLINPILIEYSNEKSISMILQKKNLIIGQKELDITIDIIKLIDNNIKEFKIK